MKLRRIFMSFLIIITVTMILVPLSPLYRLSPGDDPSVYLYVGRQILNGGAPYRDAWDHKQPLAYFVFALAQIFSPNSLWGIWWIEWIALCVMGLLALGLITRLTQASKARVPWRAVGTVIFSLVGLSVILWQYSLEELSLPLQMFCLYGLARLLQATSDRARLGWSFSIGIAAGLSFFFKQTIIAAPLAVGCYLGLRMIFQREKRIAGWLAALLGGFLFVAALVAAYLVSNGIWGAYQDAAIAYNLNYSIGGPLERFNAVLDALEYMTTVPGLFLTIALWLACSGVALFLLGPRLAQMMERSAVRVGLLVAGASLVAMCFLGELVGQNPGLGLVQILLLVCGVVLLVLGLLIMPVKFRTRLQDILQSTAFLKEDETGLKVPFFFVAVLYFPITLLLVSTSGRNYVYYFIQFFPVLILLMGLCFDLVSELSFQGRAVNLLLMTGLSLALIYAPMLALVNEYRQPLNPQMPEVVDYIRQHSTPDQTIFVWGKETTHLYFLSNRNAPSRHFYQAAISVADYNADYQIADELYQDIATHPPALFLLLGEEVTSPGCPLNTSDIPNSAGRVFKLICERYTYTAHLSGFQIYSLNP